MVDRVSAGEFDLACFGLAQWVALHHWAHLPVWDLGFAHHLVAHCQEVGCRANLS